MVGRCASGNCEISCPQACYCIADAYDPRNCLCDCIPPVFEPESKRTNRGKKIPSKYGRLKITPQGRYNICTHNAPTTALAKVFDKSLPNRILIPANKVSKNTNLRLKNKTFRQIIVTTGLTLKN